MSQSQTLERFPDFVVQPLRHGVSNIKSRTHNAMARPRRKSSGLGADIRGDTGAPAVSTLEPMPRIVSPPLSPRNSSSSVPKASKRRKARSFLRRWRKLSFVHTWVNPLILIVLILSLYRINPTPTNPLHSAIFLSYPLPADHPHIPAHARNDPNPPTFYGKGLADLAFVAFYIIVLSFTREIMMQRLIRPLAIRCGLRSRAKQYRFMEQVYTAMYFGVFGPVGLYVMSRTPVWYFNTSAMYEDFPHRSHEACFKAYYLLQASYWAQQAIVLCLQLEKPRKDFKELVGHHIVTLALIALSYRFHFTYMGVAVYVTHDISDFFLATSKTLNYIDSSLTVPYFTSFMGIWIYLRHYLNLKILYSILTTFRTVGPFVLDWSTQQYKCALSQWITFSLLFLLQLINLFWLFYILRIAYNIAFREMVEDVRSDEEGTEDEGNEKGKKANGDSKGKNGELPVGNGKLVEANGQAKASGVDGLMNGNASRHAVLQDRGNAKVANGHLGMVNGSATYPVSATGKARGKEDVRP